MYRTQTAGKHKGIDLKPVSLTGTDRSLKDEAFSILSIEDLSSASQNCGRKGDNSIAAKLHAYIRGRGLETDKVLGNVLVRLLVEVGHISDARQLFDTLSYQDDLSWNVLIKGCASQGEGEHALCLYGNLSGHDSIELWSSNFVALLKFCAEVKNFEAGSIIHADLARKGLLERDEFLSTAVVDMYAKCGSIAHAKEVFDNRSFHDVVSWTSLIAGFVQEQRVEDALYYFGNMQKMRIPPDDVTFSCCLQACTIIGDKERGQTLHIDIAKMGMDTYVFVGNTLIDMYAACGLMEDAQDVFDKVPRDLVSWNTLLAGYVDNGQYIEALSRFVQLKKEGLHPHAITLVSLLKACGVLGSIYSGQKIQSEVIKQDFERNAFVASALVGMYIKCGLLEKAQEVFEKLPIQDIVGWNNLLIGFIEKGQYERLLSSFARIRQSAISPVLATFISAMKACASLVALEKGHSVHSEVVLQGLEEDYVAGSTLLGMYSRCACLCEAQYMFKALLHVDLVSWTSLVLGQALVGDLDSVFGTLHLMFQNGVEPNPVTWCQVLYACNHSGLTNAGIMVFGFISFGLGSMPSPEHYTCMVDLFSRAGQIETAAFIIKHTPYQPGAELWHVVLAACQKCNNVEIGREAFELAMLLDEDDHASYVTVSNIFADVIAYEDLHTIEAQYW